MQTGEKNVLADSMEIKPSSKKKLIRKQGGIKLPKKSRTKYALFIQENYAKMRQSLIPTANHTIVLKKLREKWLSIRHEEKRRYAVLAEQDRKRYVKERELCNTEIIEKALK